MDFEEFARFHTAALSEDEIANNLVLSILNRASQDPSLALRYWSLGKRGRCAVQLASCGVALGSLPPEDVMALVEEMGSLEDVPSVIGSQPAADAFARAMRTKQRHFLRLERESLLVIQQPPKVTSAPGSYRQAVLSDVNVVGAWISEMANWTPARDQVENWISRRGIFIWFDGATPVSMCCLGRVLSRGVVLSHIYTRPDMRSRGYGGALTGAVSRLMLDDKRRYVLLYCSISNAAAFRCYSKIGYRLYGQSAHYHFR